MGYVFIMEKSGNAECFKIQFLEPGVLANCSIRLSH